MLYCQTQFGVGWVAKLIGWLLPVQTQVVLFCNAACPSFIDAHHPFKSIPPSNVPDWVVVVAVLRTGLVCRVCFWCGVGTTEGSNGCSCVFAGKAVGERVAEAVTAGLGVGEKEIAGALDELELCAYANKFKGANWRARSKSSVTIDVPDLFMNRNN